MPAPLAPFAFSYAVLRVVPHVEREEFVNAGIALFCEALDFLDARIALDERRLLSLAPAADVALARAHLASIPRICAGGEGSGPIGALPLGERWRWLTATRSTMIQTSPAHTGLCHRPHEELDRLVRAIVTPAAP